ncbi:hypothetical protein C8Q77DRAFT_1276525 [Trametes polyzona]|nr:hypothetical protein C8Q77DRAFT_1276525 [Trametes polyzona]
MDGSSEAGPSTGSKRPRPGAEAISEAFPPDQKRKAADICRKGTDGTGWIEGKVFQRGTPSGESWEFVVTVELGSRVRVLLSGGCSRHFGELPMAVGAQVRICLRGLVLEDLELPPKLLLPKRFVWRDGVTCHVHNPKTGEQSCIDTWADIAPSIDGDAVDTMSTLPAIPKKRRRTPMPSSPQGRSVLPRHDSPQHRHTTSSGPDVAVEAPVVSNNMLVDDIGMDMTVPDQPQASMQDAVMSNDMQPDAQNPQSLPSPPPELSQEGGTGDREQRPSPEIDVQPMAHDGAPELPPPEGNDGSPAKDSSEAHGNPQPVCLAEKGSAPPTKGRSVKERKRSSKDRRKVKQLEKAGKLVNTISGDAPDPDPQAKDVITADGEEEYWIGEESLPDEVLIDDTGQQPTTAAEAKPTPDPEGAAVVQVSQELVSNEQASMKDDEVQAGRTQEDVKDPLESLRRGCTTETVSYTPLIDFQGSGTRHIMGVIGSSATISQTKTLEFMMRFSLYDPTNYGSSGLGVTLFDKLRKGLPQVEVGDILMLRMIQIGHFNGSCAIGPSFKGWQWAVFHVKTGMLSSAPVETCALRHFTPDQAELQFSIRLADWWRDAASTSVSFDPTYLQGRRVREHKSIADAQDEEYFDCTVEVLHGLRNDNGVYSVFVTDYTRNPAVSPTQGEWCPPRVAPYVLRIELWDSSAEVGPRMQAGEYYSIRNLRTRISSGGYLEGKMQEGEKITKLDEDQLENQPRLAELLKRKIGWEAEMNATGGVQEFPHKLISEAEENHHFKCTVEVVHISPKDDFTYFYVTDYTTRPDLVPVAASIAPPALENYVVRVELRDTQVDTARNLDPGDFVAIRNLRLRPSGGGTLLCGRLGGDQRLITKLNPKASGNAELRALLKRKEEVLAAPSTSKRKGKGRGKGARATRRESPTPVDEEQSESVRVSRKSKSTRKGKQFQTLQQVKESEQCPAVFRVRARAVDFYPDDLRDCTILRCTSCDETLPKNRRRCTKCDDAMEDETAVAAFFQLWIRIADEDGTTLDVSIADERCSVLQDLSPEEVYEDDDAFAMLVARLRLVLGGLLDVRDDEARRRPLAQDEDAEPAPLMELTIGSWLPEGEPDTPESRAYVVLKHATCTEDDG